MGAGKAADLTYWEGAARTIASCATSSKIIVEKSTVPVKTAEAIEKVLRRNCADPSVQFEILSNPEFLAEGTAAGVASVSIGVVAAAGVGALIGRFAERPLWFAMSRQVGIVLAACAITFIIGQAVGINLD